jgi:hypothetical protein
MSEVIIAERPGGSAGYPVAPPQPPRSAEPPPAATKAAEPPQPTNRVAELQVTAHLMTLESGLFCVFQSPGSPPPDPVTSLPGVRITPAPGIAGRPEAVSVSTFREDGWLNGTAALIRVTDGPAQILVTIYQDKGQDAAPRLQVLRLGGDPVPAAATGEQPAIAADPAPAPAAAPAANPEVMAHVQRMGDVTCAIGDWLGVKGSRQWVEGFGLAPGNGIALSDIEYQAVLGRNWLSPWVEGGKYCGSRGMALPLLGLKIRLKGEAAKNFECSYAATFIDGSEAGPVPAGESCEAESLAALEAFQVVIRPRGAKPAERKAPARKPPEEAPAIAARPKPPARPRARL